MPSKWDYGGACLRHPISGMRVEFADGSIVQEHDIFRPLPDFMAGADLVFVDPPWNTGNLRSFYTKAGRSPHIADFTRFYHRLFACIAEIAPQVCYVEVGKEFLAEFIIEMKRIFHNVTFYNATYYHKPDNHCYIVRGGPKRQKLPLDSLDEEEIIAWICANEEYRCIADLCMGRGLVGWHAHAAGRRFVGTELNHKRLSVLVEKLSKAGLKYDTIPIERTTP